VNVTVDDDRYELMMIDYQLTQIAHLNEVLKRNGVDQGLRRSICSEFADSHGSFLDCGSFSGEAGERWPEVVFSIRTLDPQEGLGPMEEAVFPEYASNFHEYASGAVDTYFDENNETLGDIEVKRL